MNSFNLIKINNEYVKFYVTTNSQLPKLMKNSGSLVVLHKDMGTDAINELWLGNEIIASGYGFSSSKLRDNLGYVGNTYNDIFDYIQNSYAYSLNYTGAVNNYIIEHYATKRDNLTNAYVIYKNPGNNSSSEKIDLVDLVQSDHPVYEPYKVESSYYSITYSLLNCTDTVTTYNSEVVLPYGANIDKIQLFVDSKENDTNGIVTGSSYYTRYNNDPKYNKTGIVTKLTEGTKINVNNKHVDTEFTTLSVQIDYTRLESDKSKLSVRNIDTGYILKDFTLYIDCSAPKDSLGNPDYKRYKKHPYLEKILGTDHPIYVYDDFYSINKNKYVPIQNLYYKAKLPVYWKSVYINESAKFKQDISISSMLDNTIDNSLAKSDLRYSMINDDTNTVTISSTSYTTLYSTKKVNDNNIISNKTLIMIPSQYNIDYAYFNYKDGTRENCTGSIYRLTVNKYDNVLSEYDPKIVSEKYTGEIFSSKHISLPSTKSKVNANYDFYYINRYPTDMNNQNKYYTVGDSVDIHIHLIKGTPYHDKKDNDNNDNNMIDDNPEIYNTSDELSYNGVMSDKRPAQNENYNSNFMFTYSSLGSETPNLDNLSYILI